MANWKVTKTTKHGKPIEEYTAKIGKDQWKIDSMPHIGPNFGSLYRWDDLRGLRQISTGNIEMLKQQAEGISTKKDAVSDLLRGFSRPGAKALFYVQEEISRAEQMVYDGNDEAGVALLDLLQRMKRGLITGEDAKRLREVIKEAKAYGMFSRPGAKARFRVEDRFYFGKGRKDRFSDDAKQIADTILKQLGGGRFIAMTGAKNLAFSSNPPGLRMSIGRGAKDAIKYLRVDYDRGSDTYTMIFANKSGGTVKSVSHVYADSLQRVFTSTTGFDTHL